jgi:glutamate synthase (NADPH/NADH) large chain
MGGYSMAHAVMMLIPEAWAGNPLMDEDRKAFYEYHAALMEPWDGPAAVAFTDGRQIGATLDRNGLRPARYLVTDDDRRDHGVRNGRAAGRGKALSEVAPAAGQDAAHRPGRGPHHFRRGGQARAGHQANPYREWLDRTQIVLEDLKPVEPSRRCRSRRLAARPPAGLRLHPGRPQVPAGADGPDRPGSHRLDGHRHADFSALSDKSKLLYTYFKQNFAQVTNPPIDPIREELVMSLVSFIGPRPNLLDLKGLSRQKRLEVRQPILTNDDLEKIRSIGDIEDRFAPRRSTSPIRPTRARTAWKRRSTMLCERPKAVRGGYNIIILSDRRSAGPDPDPACWRRQRCTTT